jgi:Glycosyl transferase family 2
LKTPKYSVVLPTLNGRSTLSIVLPAMLAADRGDVEWVISDNRSDDGTLAWLEEVAATDPRVRVVQPRQRLCIGEHLEFAYRFARGQWLCHIGDDDMLLPDRFDVLDAMIEQSDAEIIRGKSLFYIWPEYPDTAIANSIEPEQFFSERFEVVPGAQLAAQMLNEKIVRAGGGWAVRRDIVEKVRERAGCFASPQHVEFFGMRSAACLSRRAAILDRPLFILGRHAKSSGTLAYLPKRLLGGLRWDWSVEDPQPYVFCPFPWKAYCTLSLDASLSVKALFPEALEGVEIDWPMWTDETFREAAALVRHGQLPRWAIGQFMKIVGELPVAGPLYWRWRWIRKTLERPLGLLKNVSRPVRHAVYKPRRLRLETGGGYGWAKRIMGANAGFSNIVEAAHWFSKHFLRSRPLPIATPSDVPRERSRITAPLGSRFADRLAEGALTHRSAAVETD